MSHIAMLEPEVAAAVTIPFATATADPPALRRILEVHGFAVVDGVLDAAAISNCELLWNTDLLHVVDRRASDPAAVDALAVDPAHRWPMAEIPMGKKFVSEFGLPHGRLAWHVRTHPNVRAIFRSIFETNELCVGMDNVFFENRAAQGTNAERASELWPHSDQNLYNKPSGDYMEFQGVQYLWPANSETSATVVWPGSHRDYYVGLMADERKWAGKGHFCMVPKADHQEFAVHARRVPVPAGGFLLWSSRTIHQGWPLGPRLAVPVCMEPKARRPPKVIDAKKQNFIQGAPTSHWASLGITHALHRRTEAKSANGLTVDGEAQQQLLEGGRTVPPEILDLL